MEGFIKSYFNCRLLNDFLLRASFTRYLARIVFIKSTSFWIFRIVTLFVRRFTANAAGLIASRYLSPQVRFLPFAYLSPVLSHPADVNKWRRFRKVLHWTARRWLRFFIALIPASERSQETDSGSPSRLKLHTYTNVEVSRWKEVYKFIHS